MSSALRATPAIDTAEIHFLRGQVRHGGHPVLLNNAANAVVTFDPAGNRNEIYTGGYWFDPDDEPTTWTENEIGRAIFYYQGKLNQAFMTVHS